MRDPEYGNETDYGRKLVELDRLINDPGIPIEPERVWSLLAELAARERWGAALHPDVSRAPDVICATTH